MASFDGLASAAPSPRDFAELSSGTLWRNRHRGRQGIQKLSSFMKNGRNHPCKVNTTESAALCLPFLTFENRHFELTPFTNRENIYFPPDFNELAPNRETWPPGKVDIPWYNEIESEAQQTKMATEAQIEANRNNAKQSTGPRTAEGKQRSAQNATTHGLYSKSVVLRNENREEFDALAQSYVAKARPADPVEYRLVQIMADCDWRMIRSRYVETAILDNQMDQIAAKTGETFEQVDEPARLAFAIQNLDPRQQSIYMNAQRQEARLQREYLRSFKLLQEWRKEEKNIPSEIKKE